MLDVNIKLIDKDTDLSKVKPLPWDLVVHGVPYYVAHVDGHVHAIRYHDGGEQAIDLWCWPRNEQPSYENMVEYGLSEPVSWGIEYTENRQRSKRHDHEKEKRAVRAVSFLRHAQ